MCQSNTGRVLLFEMIHVYEPLTHYFSLFTLPLHSPLCVTGLNLLVKYFLPQFLLRIFFFFLVHVPSCQWASYNQEICNGHTHTLTMFDFSEYYIPMNPSPFTFLSSPHSSYLIPHPPHPTPTRYSHSFHLLPPTLLSPIFLSPPSNIYSLLLPNSFPIQHLLSLAILPTLPLPQHSIFPHFVPSLSPHPLIFFFLPLPTPPSNTYSLPLLVLHPLSPLLQPCLPSPSNTYSLPPFFLPPSSNTYSSFLFQPPPSNNSLFLPPSPSNT